MTLNFTAFKNLDEEMATYHVSVQHEPDSTIEFIYDKPGMTLRRIYKDGTIKEMYFEKVFTMEFKEN